MTAQQRSMLFASEAVGALLAVLPSTWLMHRIGERKVFATVGFLSAVTTASVPFAASLGIKYMIIARAAQGVGLAACLPVMGSVTAHWSSRSENGLFVGVLSTSIQLASMFTMPISGALCVSDGGWPSVYYVHAVLSAALFLLWSICYRDSPHKHPCVAESELRKILHNNERALSRKERRPVPYKAIITSSAVWAIWIASIGNFFGMQLVIQFMPTYMNKVLGFSITKTGITTALPLCLQFVVKMVAGPSSDKIHCVTELTKLRLFNTFAMCGMATFFVALAFIPPSEPTWALLCFIGSTCCLGLSCGGFLKSSSLVAHQYSQFVMAIIQAFMCITILILPFVVGALAPNNLATEWRIIFLINAGILLLANAFFCLFGSAERAEWADETRDGKNDPVRF
uniref:Major facilitator superfamily (MFS) profile domain-containing protein n=1 Tax=Plectus sambesii TaxID=2011161 RepID=A0A914XIQ3_9BILA